MNYSGIGSRETPDDILELMKAVAYKLAGRGYTLRSGGADGAIGGSVGGKPSPATGDRTSAGRASACFGLQRTLHGGDEHGRGDHLHLAAGDFHRHLAAAGTGQAFAGFGVADQVVDLQAVLPLHQAGANVDALAKCCTAYIP